MKENKTTHAKKQTKPEAKPKASAIKLGLDLSADAIVVVRQVDGATPQPAQSFGWEAFLKWVPGQSALARKVHSCYEAGPFGYGLHRKLEALGIENVVIRAVNLDAEHKGVKSDAIDARELCLRLDRYVGGNAKACSVVRVPSPEQELARSESRQREQVMVHRKRWEAQGRSLLLYYGHRARGRWWWGALWEKLRERLSAELLPLVESIQEETLRLWERERERTAALEASEEREPLPVGFGRLTSELLRREMLDWEGFANRRQVGSMTGLCPGVSESGNTRRERPVTKCGRPRVRAALIELAWRLTRFQPDYPPVRQFHRRCPQRHSAGTRKKAIVALARKTAIDWWRMSTGRCTAEALGLRMPK